MRSLLLTALLLAGCGLHDRAVDNAHDVAEAAAAAATDAGAEAGWAIEKSQRTAVEAVTPPVLALQAGVEAVAPLAPERPALHRPDPRIVDHIVRWEVSSPAAYTAKWQGVICPGLASGPTWGIGYDGGQQTRQTILSDWSIRPDVAKLATASGAVGNGACNAVRRQLLDVRVPYAQAREVFVDVSYPGWSRVTKRVYPGVEALPELAGGALLGNTYNRGSSMAGSRNAEKRFIRDTCIPDHDVQCVADQLRAQKRLWPNTKGVRDRREDEAKLALTR